MAREKKPYDLQCCPERMRKGVDGRDRSWRAADACHETEERQIARRNEGRAQNGADTLFLGHFERKVSRSGLVRLPSEWRKVLGGDSLFMMRDITDANAFCLVPELAYERELRVSHEGNYSVEQRNVLESAKRLHVDARGRIRFPAEAMNLIGGGGRIVLVGQARSIQMRSPDESSLHEDDDLLRNVLSMFVGNERTS